MTESWLPCSQLSEQDDIVALWEMGMNLPVLADADTASDWDGIANALLDDTLLGDCSDLWISQETRAAAVKDAALERSINSRVPHCSAPLITVSVGAISW